MGSPPMSSAAAPRACSQVLKLPPGYHFLPTDAELVVHYLRPTLANANHRLPLPIFVHERILNYHPDGLTEKYRNYGEGRWFFFTVRERKHSCGNRPNRTTPDNGHWNATGSIRPIRCGGVLVGCRRTLVFYAASRRQKKSQAGLPPTEEEEERGQGAKAKDGVKTDWTMYEYESLASEAEFEAIRSGNNANKMDVVVLCTIQKKKHSQEGKEGGRETKKSTKRKTKEEEGLEAAPAAGDVQQGSRAGTTEGQDEDDVQRTLMEEAAAAEPPPELAYHDAPAGVGGNFSVDPNQRSMPYYHLTNSLSPVPMPPQETVMAPGRGDNQNVMLQQNYYFINQSMNMMKNSQPFHAQATPPQEFLPDTKMAAPRGGGNTMDHMLQNRLVNMTPSPAPPVLGTGTYLSPWRSKLDMPLKSEDALWSSNCRAKLAGREPNSSYVTDNLSLVPTSQRETVMALLAARGYNHTAMHQRNYFNHSMITGDSQFHVQTNLTQEEFLPYSSTQMAAPLGGGNVMDHHMLQNRIVSMEPAAETHAFNGYGPVLSNSSYGHGGCAGDYDHLGTIMGHPEPSRFSIQSQQSQGPLLNNQVSLNHQNPAASMVGYDQSNGVSLAPKIA